MDEVDSEGLLGHSARRASRRDRWRPQCKFYLATASVLFNIVAAVTLAYQMASEAGRCNRKPYSYEHGFDTDLNAIKDVIELVQYDFGGGVELDHHGGFLTDTRGHQYVGYPTPEIDQAWASLLLGLNLDLDDDEGMDTNSFQWPEDAAYFSGLEVFHSLHCLNRLRQAFYPNVYTKLFNNPKDPSREHHLAHCINHLRQAIQCHSDLTPMRWAKVGDKVILNTNTRHTCRNFEKIRRWAAERRTRYDRHESFTNNTLHIVD